MGRKESNKTKTKSPALIMENDGSNYMRLFQTVLCGDVYCVISMSVELTNVTLELLASHDQGLIM